MRKLTRSFGLWSGVLTLAVAGALAHGARWSWAASYLVAVNAVTFVLYGVDKGLSRRRKGPRVPERTLHLIALAGGTPGAVTGQQVFRHKTRKASFRLAFWIIAVLQASLLGVLLWHSGVWR